MIFKSIITLVLLSSVTIQGDRIKISNNGYYDIVVAFNSFITPAEGEPLINRIKELFTSGSEALYRATRQRAYFRDVTILVPKNWPKRSDYSIASFEAFTKADVKIEEPNSQYGNNPYTLQPLPCGKPGRYIHLTPNYLKYLHDNSTKSFGDPGKTLVHEWAHLRYGIFDEFFEENIDEFPSFYIDPDTENVLPNACTNKPLKGIQWNIKSNQHCRNEMNGLPERDCIFIIDPSQNKDVTSSLASYHFLPNVHTFCDDTKEFAHNRYAPNRHNRLCKGKSTWNIISNHEDFKNSNPSTNIPSTAPSFKIVQEEDANFILVLDISSSMNAETGGGQTRIGMLNEAAIRFIKEEVKIGTAVGIVLFGLGSSLAQPLVRITNEAIRQQLINKVPNSANGMTCIGCGLKTAADDLKRFRRGAKGGIIVLLSDGEENQSPYIIDVRQEMINSKIRIITIAFSTSASKAMDELALATGGKSFFVPISASSVYLNIAFHEVSTLQTTEVDVTAKIAEKRFQNSGGNFEGKFTVDASIGRDTAVSFVYVDRSDIIDVKIQGPGISVSLGTPSSHGTTVELNDLLRQFRFVFATLQVGVYKYTITRRGYTSQDVTVSVFSKSRKKGENHLHVTSAVVEVDKTLPPKFVIMAEVKKGSSPIINANVIAKIDRPNNYPSIVLQLFDTGKKGDVVRNDGIYSAYFTRVSGSGRYIVQANVVANVKTAILESGFTASNALPILTVNSKSRNITTTPTGDFERIADAGSIQIKENFNAETTDLFPPSRTHDLHVVNISHQRVTFKWSAPGDELYNGQAAEYELKYTMDYDLLNTNFYGRMSNETGKPKPAGEEEEITVTLTGLGPRIIYYAALRTKDKAGKWSEISNIVEIKGK